jgi:hypothetical protein
VKYHVQRDWTRETIGVTDEFGGPGYLTMDKYTGDVEFHPSGAITPEEPSSLQIWLGLPAAFVGGQAVSSLAASSKAVATTLKVGGVLTTGAMAYTTEEYVRAAYVSAQAGDKASMWENIEDATLAGVATIASAYGTYRAFAVGDGSTVQTPGSPRGSATRLVVTDSRGNVVGEVPLVTARAPARVPELPAFNGQTTHGVLITSEGKVIPLQSGNPSPTYANYAAASHVEGKAALAIRESGSSGGVVYHNNPSGTCGFCNSQVPTLLPEGVQLRVVPPAGTVPPGPRWYVPSKPYVGNSAIPKPNPQLGR